MQMFQGITKLAEEGDEEGVRRMLDEGTPVDYISDKGLQSLQGRRHGPLTLQPAEPGLARSRPAAQ
jgi:hypothetical protein